MKKAIRLACTALALAFRLLPMEGRAGRYMFDGKGAYGRDKAQYQGDAQKVGWHE